MIINPPKNYGNYIIYEQRENSIGNLLYIGACKFIEFGKFQNERSPAHDFPNISEFKIIGMCDNIEDAEAHARNLRALFSPQFFPVTKQTPETSKRVRCITTGREYESVTDAALCENIPRPNLHHHLVQRPGYKTIKGKVFERVTLAPPETRITPSKPITPYESKPLAINWRKNWCVVRYVIEGVIASYSLKSISNLSNFHDLTQIKELCIIFMTRQYEIDLQIISQHKTYDEAKSVLDLAKKLVPPRYGNKIAAEKYPKYRCLNSGYEFMTTLEIAEYYGITINAINEHISKRAYKNGVMCDDGIRRTFERI